MEVFFNHFGTFFRNSVHDIIKLLQYEKLAEKPEVFLYPFRDTAREENQPYITLCYILNILKGDEQGNFHAEETLTRAETAMILYNILK